MIKLLSKPDPIDVWCGNQTRFWEHIYTGPRNFTAALQELNEITSTVFIFEFEGDEVRIRDKPSTHFDPPALSKYHVAARSAELYLSFFQAIVLAGMRVNTALAVDLYDISLHGIDVPVFCFQKVLSNRNILLPDIDFLWHEWYEHGSHERSWENKLPKAFFAGSSTGGNLLSLDDVHHARPQRLKWARYAVGSPLIDFRICDAVQCDTIETSNELKSQSYFSAVTSWEEQLLHRYIISLDGNGATCSRVIKVLKSSSILLKTPSINQLYYYDGLQPYKHYIPVNSIEEVEQAVKDLESGRLCHEEITLAANQFYNLYLRRESVIKYTRKLLERYCRYVVNRR